MCNRRTARSWLPFFSAPSGSRFVTRMVKRIPKRSKVLGGRADDIKGIYLYK